MGGYKEGDSCMNGPCDDGLACIKGICSTYSRTAYLMGEYDYDRGECPEGNEYCLPRCVECLNFNTKYRYTPSNLNNFGWENNFAQTIVLGLTNAMGIITGVSLDVGLYQNPWHIADPLLGLVSCNDTLCRLEPN